MTTIEVVLSGKLVKKNIAQCLLSNGTNVNLRNNNGSNPLWIAHLSRDESIEQSFTKEWP